MRSVYISILLIAFTFYFVQGQKHYEYPIAPVDETVETYFGDSIADPYRWMENPEDIRLTTWLKSQSGLIHKEERHQNYEDVLETQIRSMYADSNSYGSDETIRIFEKNYGKYAFKNKYSRIDRYPDIYYKLSGEDKYKLLVKIKDLKLSREDQVVVMHKHVNPEHDLMALEISRNGSDWREIVFYDLKEGTPLPDTLKYLRASSNLVWHGKNLYYDRFDVPVEGRELLDKATGQKLYYHTLGSPQSEDTLLFTNPDRSGTYIFSYFKMDDKLFFYHYLKVKGKLVHVLSVGNYNAKSIFLRNFLIYPTGQSLDFEIEEAIGDKAYIRTNWNAPHYKVIKVDLNQLNKSEDFIPEFDVVLTEVNRLGQDKIVGMYKKGNRDLAMIYDLEGALLKKIPFNKGKKVKDFFENDPEITETVFRVSSFYHPDLHYSINLDNLKIRALDSLSVPYNPKSLETKYINYTSKDGTEIPMYITCLKGTELNGNNPTILEGYGGYGVVLEPNYDEDKVLWMLHGGILAVPGIRGGGANGSDWSLAGRRLNKQNAVDDFIAAAEYLIKEKYTSSSKLAIEGGSHGGMLVGAAVTQRPELFKAAIGRAGVYDLMRFENYTIGSIANSINEFGSMANPEDYQNLKNISPLHHIQDGIKYPDILLITGDHDDRVAPFHSYKMMAELQSKAQNTSKYLLYVVPGAGHYGATHGEQYLNMLMFKNYFLFDRLGLDFN